MSDPLKCRTETRSGKFERLITAKQKSRPMDVKIQSLAGNSITSTRPVLEPWEREPTMREVLMLWLMTCFIFVACIAPLCDYFALVDNSGDCSAYMAVAAAIRHWNFHGLMVKQFWGLPYAMAVLSLVTGMSDRTALMLICFGSSLISVGIAYRLWGGWIAGFFAILNFDWMQRSYLGGSEPLFVALLFASFLAIRKDRWWLASLLASLATVVRPLGIFALIGIGLVLLWRQDYRRLVPAVITGLAIGILYSLPLMKQFNDPLATTHSYVNPEWQGGWLFGIPFYAIIKGTLTEPAPWTNLVLSFGWIFIVLIAVIVMITSSEFREYARAHPVETLFLIPYILSLYTYNYPHWARGNFPRFSIPILPFVLVALCRWISKDRRLLWALGIVTSIAAAASGVGIANVPGLIRRAIG
jgi:hypothetical protein